MKAVLSRVAAQGVVSADFRAALEELALHKGQVLPGDLFETGLRQPGQSTGAVMASPEQLKRLADKAQAISQLVRQRYFQLEVLKNRGLSYPPASEATLAAAETRLGCRLTASYRSFLLESDGWLAKPFGLVGVDAIGRFADIAPDHVADWTADMYEVPDDEYFVYGKGQDPGAIRRDYLPSMLALSLPLERNNEWCLLNPQVVFDDGENEIWWLSPQIAGAIRYRSFPVFMEALFETEARELRR